MRDPSTFKFFKDLSGKIYRKETDYAKRSWWYIREFEYGYVMHWAIHDGKPLVSLEEITENQAISAN